MQAAAAAAAAEAAALAKAKEEEEGQDRGARHVQKARGRRKGTLRVSRQMWPFELTLQW